MLGWNSLLLHANLGKATWKNFITELSFEDIKKYWENVWNDVSIIVLINSYLAIMILSIINLINKISKKLKYNPQLSQN